MIRNTRDTTERAVSPVVGVALLIAIAVILAAMIGAVVLGLGTGGADTPQAQLTASFDDDSNTVTIYHQGGEPLDGSEIVVNGIDGDDDGPADESELTAGTSWEFDIDGNGDDVEVTLIWQDPNGNSEHVIASFEP